MALAPSPRTVRVGAVLVSLLAVGLGGLIALDALRLIGRPFAGFGMLPEGTVAVLRLSPVRLSAATRDLRFDDRIVAVDGAPVSSAAEVQRIVESVPAGTPLRYTVRRPGGATQEAVVPTAVFEGRDYVQLCLPVLVGGALGIALGLLPLLAHPGQLAARIFFLFNVGLAVNFAFLMPDAYLTHRLPRYGFLAAALAVGTFLHLGLLLPVQRAPLRTHPRATLAVIYALAALQGVLHALHAPGAFALMAALFSLGLFVLTGNVVAAAFRARDPLRRQQARVILPGFVAALASGALFIASNVGLVDWGLPLAAFQAPLWVLGALLAYAMLELNMFEVDAFVRRALAVGLLCVLAIVVYLGIFLLLDRVLDVTVALALAGGATVMLAAVVPAVAPLRRGLEGLVELALFPEQRAARELIRGASRELARLRDEAELVRFLRDTARRALTCADVRLVCGARGEALAEVAAEEGMKPLELAAGDPLAGLLERGSAVRFDPRVEARARSASERAAAKRAGALGVALAAPLAASGSHAGGLLLGPRSDGRIYTREDELLIDTLAAHTATALENARAWSEVRRLEQRLAAENVYLREEVETLHDVAGIVGRGPAIRAVLERIDRVAPTDATVLVIGETGTGKELVVRAIHAASRRASRVLVKVACAALPEPLLESELFGHERGAFTGAGAAKPGRFEVADGGTIFFDDVDTLPLGVQAKLLRALQEGEIQRLGSNRVRRVDVRVIAATNRNLLDEVRAGRFREDLYYRLNVVPLHVPALRERAEDIPLLVEHFARKDAPGLGRAIEAVSAEAMAELCAYSWPGNVRELRNVIQRSLVLASDAVLRLPGPLAVSAPSADAAAGADGGGRSASAPLADQVRDLKVRLIREALAAAGGNHRIAAERLGLHRQSLTRMIHDLGLQEAVESARPVLRRAPTRSEPPPATPGALGTPAPPASLRNRGDD